MAAFHWRKGTHGYKWTADDDGTDEFDSGPHFSLEPIIYEYQEYQPFEQPELFQEFAHLDLDPDAMLKFANKYGHLGTYFHEPDEPLEPGDNIRTPRQLRKWKREIYLDRTIWDPLEHWELAITTMRSCVQQWRRVRLGKGGLKDRDDLLVRINDEIVKHPVEVQLEPSERSPSGFRMSYVPRNLLGAMWVQFAQAITDNEDFRQCETCKKWYPVTPGKNRKSRIYCSDACKSKAYRQRQDQARKMRKAGRTYEEIGAALGADPQTVQKWLVTV